MLLLYHKTAGVSHRTARDLDAPRWHHMLSSIRKPDRLTTTRLEDPRYGRCGAALRSFIIPSIRRQASSGVSMFAQSRFNSFCTSSTSD